MEAAILSAFGTLTLCQEVNLALLWGSIALCLLAICAGRCMRRGLADGAEPAPLCGKCVFPNIYDALLVFVIVALLALDHTLPLIDPKPAPEGTVQSVPMVAILNQILIYVPLLLRYMWLPSSSLRDALSLRTLAGVLLTLVAIYILQILYFKSGLYESIVTLLDAPKDQAAVTMLQSGDTSTLVCIIIGSVVVAPVVEECCFRGFLYRVIKRYSRSGAATVCSSLVFGAVHMSIAHIIPLFMLAMLLCRLYEKSGTLIAPILAHSLFNAISVVAILYFP